MKSKILAYLLWLIGLCGCLGFHRFYLGKTKTGLLWLFSGGLLGIGSLIDLISLGEQVNQVNNLCILKKLASGEVVGDFEPQSEEIRNGLIAEGSFCPYCFGLLEHKPKRNTKCPVCQKEIYIRATPVIFDHNLLTAEDALMVDKLSDLARLGISTEDFIHKRDELYRNFSMEITSVDVFWSLLKRAMLDAKDPATLKNIQRCLALFIKELGLDFYVILQRATKMQLLELRNDGFTKQVRVIADPKACPACRQLDGKIYTIEEALRLMPLPCKECTNKLNKSISGFCRCRYQVENN